MLDHFGWNVRDLARSVAFYERCLAPLGLTKIDAGDGFAIFGDRTRDDAPYLWIGTLVPSFWTGEHRPGAAPIHVAFRAPDQRAVDAFHREGLAAGGRDNGAPGRREDGLTYYAAFLIDPDGNNVEAAVRLAR
ncbi:VOC family protein [Sandaracinus amylolyticus]|uniref:Lactoylglutathione lyase n=1 Tax=Sandaracinus amylolyticus TaxID=927083 RepID=A0A0F6W4F4_9BACT|nr:VOC family protein [Sandaracinus amylolyticus]AKF07225.1 Lactoylglutathione lyase [Sandaracinus amylolyticus]